MFGQKKEPSSVLRYSTGDAGCLDRVGSEVSSFASGQIADKELTGAWSCVTSSLTLFAQFIRGSVSNGYTPEDIQAFMSHFLFTKAAIKLELVQSIFALKASIFGGDPGVFTFEEVNQVLALLNVFQTESVRILPYLKTRATNPTPSNLLALAKAIQTSGKNVSAALKDGTSHPTFTVDQIQTLVTEIQQIILPSASTDESTGQLVVAIKQLLALGGDKGIEGSAWPTLFQGIADYLGPAIMAASAPSAVQLTGMTMDAPSWSAILSQLGDALGDTMRIHGGAIPFTAISNVIQYLPDSTVSPAQKTALIGAQNMVFTRLLQSKTPAAIDSNLTAYLTQKVTFWAQAQNHLENIYTRNGLDPHGGATRDQLKVAMAATPPPSAESAQWISDLLANYNPYFVGNDSEIYLVPMSRFGLHDMSTKHMIRVIATILLNGYSTNADRTKIGFTDFNQLVQDLMPVLSAFHMTDPSIPNAAQARFLQANLFMPSSNGDDFVDLNEGSQYILYYLSINQQADRILPLVSGACPSHGIDPYNAPLLSAECFRKNYFANTSLFWDRMPLLQRYYAGLNAGDQQSFQNQIEAAARLYGHTDQCVGMYDIQGFAGILHYIETVLQRFDLKGDGVLDTTETLNAFPVFQNEIITAGASHGLSASNTGEQQAAFAYILAKGVMPGSNFWGDIDFAWWWLVEGQSNWNVHAGRSSLFSAVAGISPPPAPPGPSQCQ